MAKDDRDFKRWPVGGRPRQPGSRNRNAPNGEAERERRRNLWLDNPPPPQPKQRKGFFDD